MSNLVTTLATQRARASWRARWPSAQTRYELIGLAAALVALAAIVILAEPYGRVWGTGQDAYCYYQATLADPYARSEWTNPIAYVYSPAFLQLVSPITRLPWQAFMAVWTIILLVGVRFLTGPRFFALGVLFALMELAGGNIEILIAVAIVIGFRWPAAWSFVLLTKVTPGIGLLWFAVRREWNQLATALVATGMVIATSAILLPGAWSEWLTVLSTVSGRDGTWAAVPIPLIVRMPFAIAVVTWGAMTDRRWTVPVAGMIALPALWYGAFSMLLATIALQRPEWRDTGGSGQGASREPLRARQLRSAAPA
jgi:Glycosyltransferase family 87